MYLILQIWKGIHKQQTRPNLYKQNIYTVFRRMLACHKCAKWMLFIVPMNASTLTYKFLYRVITIKGCFIRLEKEEISMEKCWNVNICIAEGSPEQMFAIFNSCGWKNAE